LAACSGEIITPKLQEELDKAGFNAFYQVPMTATTIRDCLMPELRQRDIKIAQKFIINSIKDNFHENLCLSIEVLNCRH
jgi:hypothetical protein